MSDGRFSLLVWYAALGAGPRERNALRQDLVRGLKDYFESVYGYDRYGAETIFQLEDRLVEPYIYGFAAKRIFRDRRLPHDVKVRAAQWALDHVRYGIEGGIPFCFISAINELCQSDNLPTPGFRYALTVCMSDQHPFKGLDRGESLIFVRALLGQIFMPAPERLFWVHSLLARHRDDAAAVTLLDGVLADDAFSIEARIELCWAWLHCRQPWLVVEAPADDGTAYGRFVSVHMPFWVAHMPAWPSLTMVRRAPVWLVRLGADPAEIAQKYLEYRGPFADQIHQAVADILLENVGRIETVALRELIERGLGSHMGVLARRGLYRAGIEAFGADYLDRASADTAGSVRDWASRQQERIRQASR